MARFNVLLLAVLLPCAVAVRINFTSCHNPEWSCASYELGDITYTCPRMGENNFTLHLKDYYSDNITSLTILNCKNLQIALDCPVLQRASHLQRLKIKDCDKLEFTSLYSYSLTQTPPEVTIENVKEVISLPRRMFKSPNSDTELKCLGATTLRKIRVTNSKINSINTKAIYNVTGIKNIEFNNVTILEIQNQAIDAQMGVDNSVFAITNSRIESFKLRSVVVQSVTATITNNVFYDIATNNINITSEHLLLTGNRFEQINANGVILQSVNFEIKNNDISLLRNNALTSVKCLQKRDTRKQFSFSTNRIVTVEPHSLTFDHASCSSIGTTVSFENNRIDCKCGNIAFLNSPSELNTIILDTANNNTCLSAPCVLPVDVIKILLESDMCRLKLDPQVMCLLYIDKHANNSESDDEVTEPPPTFYLIRQANAPNGAVSAMTALNKDDLLKDSNLNMTNRTAIKVVFDSSRDFVETLRSTSSSHKRASDVSKPHNREVYPNRCVGAQCRNNVAYDKQKALDFYRYVYAQLRPPLQTDQKKKKT